MSDFSTMDDRALGDAVAEDVLGWAPAWNALGFPVWQPVQDDRVIDDEYMAREFLTWWGAGLVIDKLREEGWMFSFFSDSTEWTEECSATFRHGSTHGMSTTYSPVRAILFAALRAKGAE